MPTVNRSDIQIVLSAPHYVQEIEAVQRAVYTGSKTDHSPDALHVEHFLRQIEVFPEAQFVALDTATGRVIGHTSGMLMDFDETQPFTQSWIETTGGGMFTTHKPHGEWMYGVESAVLSEYQGKGVGSRLYEARFDVARRLNLRGMVAGSVIMDYGKVAHEMTPEDYVREVVAGLRFDTNLTKQLKKGFRVHNVMMDYVSDKSSLGCGAAIVWYNPDYRPSA
jgi:GNAT superfamily N-acetyltransferase